MYEDEDNRIEKTMESINLMYENIGDDMSIEQLEEIKNRHETLIEQSAFWLEQNNKELTIQSPFAIYEIRILSLHGQAVQQHVFEGIEDDISLRLLDLPSGIYLIQVNGLREGTTKKLVVE